MAAAAVLSSSTFLKVIRENNLVDDAKLQDCLNKLTEDVKASDDARPIAEALVNEKCLTRFQVQLLLQGKSKSLRITSKYRLLDRIGAGGMGLVYLCEHIRMKRLVALKVLPNSQAKEPGNLERFFREAQAVAALNHPNIVKAYDVDTDNGIHYLVMEYIEGLNLEKLIAKRGPLDPVRAAHYIAQAADALQHAADRNLIHRDIKPSNLLLDREGHIKVLDMGLARFFDAKTDNLTARFDSNSVMGTADFISPEQALNSHDVDIRADIYSLGCTFYYLLTGRTPFPDANITQKLLLHQVGDPTPVEQILVGLDLGLAAIVRKMMAKRPADRFQTPGEIVEALKPWTEDSTASPLELPNNPLTDQSVRNGTGSTLSDRATASLSDSSQRQDQRTSRRRVTERLAESAVRRMDGLPRRNRKRSARKKRRLTGVALALLFIGGIVLTSLKPWRSTPSKPATPPDAAQNVDEQIALFLNRLPSIERKVTPPPKTPTPPSGFMSIGFDKTPQLENPNDGLRTLPTDVLMFSGQVLDRSDRLESPLRQALHKQMIGGAQPPSSPIVPFAVAIEPPGKIPNTLITVRENGGLRPLVLNETDYRISQDFAQLPSDCNVLVRENASIPKGLTTINSLVAAPVDFTAEEEGSTLRVKSGALLFSSTALSKTATFGAGKFSLILDFNGHTGYVTLCGEQDYSKQSGNKEFVLRARASNFGVGALVLSGVSGTVLRLDNIANGNPKLVVQGTQLTIKDKVFRVVFAADACLGIPGAPIALNNAALAMTGNVAVEVPRSLAIVQRGQLSGNSKGSLRWLGKITGDKLSITGGQVILGHRDNDFNGLEVTNATLVLAADGGTPAGSGDVAIQANGALVGPGILKQDLVIQGGSLHPGGDGKPLVCNGRLTFERSMAGTSKNMEKTPILRFRLNGPKELQLVYANAAALNLSQAAPQFMLAPGFTPRAGTICPLIVNRSGQRVLPFAGAAHGERVKTGDGKWTARISYEANIERNQADGGQDVMLHDFIAATP